jgi:hypothetical protein
LFLHSYADQAKKIVNVAVVNEDKNTKLIDALKFEVEELRRQLAEKEGKLGLAPAKPVTLIERVEVEVLRDNPELAAQVAALKIQNSFRSKLMARLQLQWREKLAESAAAAAEREEALKVRAFSVCCLLLAIMISFCVAATVDLTLSEAGHASGQRFCRTFSGFQQHQR